MMDANSGDDDRFAKLLDDYASACLANDADNFWDHQSCSPELKQRVERAYDGLLQLDTFLTRRKLTDSEAVASTKIRELLRLPTQLDRFLIVRELGRGGFGVVYLANDPLLNRQVAIKIPRLETLGASSLQNRFAKEAEIAAGLDHPHIVPVFEVGSAGSGIYIVSLYCPGTNLAQWLLEHAGELLSPQIVEVMIGICEAMAYCHERGVLHRDLKPANVLLFPAPFGSLSFMPRINDFGLAKIVESTLSDTASSAMLGTPLYMSPEQVSSQFDKIGPATDVYGLGAILYELLTDKPPFSGTVTDLLDQIRLKPPVNPRELRSDIPVDLETICLKCLAKQPADRYSSASELLADLRAFQTGQPILARRPNALKLLQRSLASIPRNVLYGAVLPTMFAMFVLLGWAVGVLSIRPAAPVAGEPNSAAVASSTDRAAQHVQHAHFLRRAFDGLRLGKPRDTSEHLQASQKALANDDPCSFAWHYLNKRGNHVRQTFDGFASEVLCADISPDGKWYAGGDRTGEVRIWNSVGELAKSFHNSDKEMCAVEFSPDGKMLATAGQGSQIHIWHTESWEPVCVLNEFQGTINGLAWSPDSTRIACGSRQNRVSMWDVAANTRLKILKPVSDTVRDVAWSADGRFVAAVTGSNIIIWNANSAEVLKEIAVSTKELHGVVISPDSKKLLAAGFSEKLIFVNLEDMDEVTEIATTGPLRDVDWSADGRHFAGALSFGGPRIWSAELLSEEATLERSFARVAKFSPDVSGLLSSEESVRALTLWNLSSALGYREIALDEPTLAWDASEAGLTCVASGASTKVQLIGRAEPLLELPGEVTCADLNVKVGLMACQRAGKIELWNLETKSLVTNLPQPNFDIIHMALTVDGQRLYVSGNIDDWAIYNLVQSSMLVEGQADHTYVAGAHAISDDGKLIVVRRYPDNIGNSWQNFELRDLAGGNQIRVLKIEHTVRAVVGNADFSTLYVADSDGIHIYNVANELTNSSHFRLCRGIGRMALSPDGLTLAVWVSDEGLFLWDVRTGQELFPILETRDVIDQMQFTSNTQLVCRRQHADGSRIVVFDCDSASIKRTVGLADGSKASH